MQGAGGLGLQAAAVARDLGASVVIAIDRIPGRLELARAFGADHTIDLRQVSDRKERVNLVRALTGGAGAHVVCDFVGFPEVIPEGLEMLRQGVNVALGTDGAASNHSQDLFDTMKAASLLQKVHHQNAGVIDPYSVLRMATAGGAKALGLDSICGIIEVGKRADLIVLRTAQALAAANVPRRRITRSMKELHRHLPGAMPLSGLSICAEGELYQALTPGVFRERLAQLLSAPGRDSDREKEKEKEKEKDKESLTERAATKRLEA